MRIEIIDNDKKEYYDEVLYVSSHYKRFLNNPTRKAKGEAQNTIVWTIITTVILIVFLIMYFTTKSMNNLYIAGLYMLILAYALYYLSLVNKRIDLMMNSDLKKSVEINNQYVEYEDGKQSLKINWDEIAYVMIQKYSICFIPKSPTSLFVTISRLYQDQVLKAVEQAGKSSLVIDNSKAYK